MLALGVLVLLAIPTTALSGASATNSGHELPGAAAWSVELPRAAGVPPASPRRSSTAGPGSVFETVVLRNDTVRSGNFLAANEPDPTAITYDPADGYAFFISENARVVVWDPATNVYVASIPVSGYPVALVLDPTDSRLFAVNDASHNLSIIDTSTLNVIGSTPVGGGPLSAAWDPANDLLYVANEFNNNVTIVDAATGKTVGSFGVGSAPWGVAYDAPGDSILVANAASDNVSVYDLGTGSVVSSISVGLTPESIAVDATDNLVIVPNYRGDYASVFSATSYGPVNPVGVGTEPDGVNVSASGRVYVENYGSDNVTVFAGSNPYLPHVNLPEGLDPVAAAFDPSSGDEYATNEYSNNISAISDSTVSIVTSYLTALDPTAVAFGPVHQNYYVADGLPQLLAVNATTHLVVGAVPVPITPSYLLDVPSLGELWMSGTDANGVAWIAALDEITLSVVLMHGTVGVGPLAYDATDNTICLANQWGNVTLIDPSTGIGTASIALPLIDHSYSPVPAGIVWDPANDYLYVTSGSYNNSVTVVSVVGQSVVAGLPTGSSPGAIALDPANSLVYVVNEVSQNLSIITPASETSAPGAPTGSAPVSIALDSANGYLYVANSGSNNVSIIDPASDAPVANLAVGSDPADLTYAPYLDNVSVTNEDQGTLSLIGTSSGPPPTYSVTFYTNRASCTIMFNGVTYANGSTDPSVAAGSNTIVGNVCSGEAFNLWSSTVGTVTAPTSASTTVDVTSSGSLIAYYWSVPSAYTVTFGTSPETTCVIDFNGGVYTSGQSDPDLPGGVYALKAATCPGYTFSSWASTAGTVVTPTSAATSLDLTATGTVTAVFTTSTVYSVTFTESGLPSGATWSVDVEGSTSTSTSTSIVLQEPNGVYGVTIALAGSGNNLYQPSVPVGSLTLLPSLLPCQSPYCGTLYVSGAPVSNNIVYGQTWVTNWLPTRDMYAFGNPGSLYSPGGNCYGISETAVLYWMNEINGQTRYPYLPLQPGGAASTADLTDSSFNTLNNATLAIAVHQLLDPENVATVGVLRSSTFDESTEFNRLEDDVAIPGGSPTVIAMGDPTVKTQYGPETVYHAVIVYAMTEYPNETWMFDISDPNIPQVGMHAWYYPSNTSYVYQDGLKWTQFAPAPLDMLGAGFLTNFNKYFSTPWNYIPSPPYSFVMTTTPVVINTIPLLRQGREGPIYSDSFGDNGGGNSQTFAQGISGSVGIEEDSMQLYGIPSGVRYVIDPPAASSNALVLWTVNASGVPSYYDFTVGTKAPGPGEYNITPNADGFNLTTPTSMTLRNLSFYHGGASSFTLFNAYNLTLAAGVTARFTVDSWQGLNSTQTPSVTLQVYPNGSSSPSATYQLVNGENGLPALPSSSPASPLLMYLDLALAFVLAVLVVAYFRVRGRKSSQSSAPDTKKSEPAERARRSEEAVEEDATASRGTLAPDDDEKNATDTEGPGAPTDNPP